MRQREVVPTSAADVLATSGEALATEDSSPNIEGVVGNLQPKVPVLAAVETQPLVPLATLTPAKAVPRSEAEEDAAYVAQVAQLKERRAREIAHSTATSLSLRKTAKQPGRCRSERP